MFHTAVPASAAMPAPQVLFDTTPRHELWVGADIRRRMVSDILDTVKHQGSRTVCRDDLKTLGWTDMQLNRYGGQAAIAAASQLDPVLNSEFSHPAGAQDGASTVTPGFLPAGAGPTPAPVVPTTTATAQPELHHEPHSVLLLDVKDVMRRNDETLARISALQDQMLNEVKQLRHNAMTLQARINRLESLSA
jgi:hypothetical protein